MDMTTEEGLYAYETVNKATPFDEAYYDYSLAQIQQLLAANTKSPFIYIRYMYNQLGKGDEYLQDMIKELEEDWEAIRREVLLEWAQSSGNCPFEQDDLEKIKAKLKQPNQVETIMLCGIYKMYIYDKLGDSMYPPIIGVDVAGGYSKDSSAITIIDSRTTKVLACLNCNYISIDHLAACIYELVTVYMPNAIVNIERNGGFGNALIAKLMNTRIRRNLYFEIKEKVLEERLDGVHTNKIKKRVQEYGCTSTSETRGLLIEILRERVNYHKDKFNSDIIYNEMRCMEVKKNGRIEHSSTSHDDQVFSYLWALYVWYYGKNTLENWGLYKNSLKYDSETTDQIIIDESDYETTIPLDEDPNDEFEQAVQEAVKLQEESARSTMSFEIWVQKEHENDMLATKKLLSTPLGRKRMQQATGVIYNDQSPEYSRTTLPDDIYDMDSTNSEDDGNKYIFTSLEDAYKHKNNIYS